MKEKSIHSKVVVLAVMITFLMGLSFVICKDADENEKEVTAEGVAAITPSKDKLKAEEEALTDAMRNAVEQGVGVYVDSQTVTKNYQLIRDNILAKARGIVKSYDVLDKKVENDLVRIKISAVVSLSQLREDLAAIGLYKQLLSYPTMMVLGVEKLDGIVLDQFIVGNIMNEKLLEKTFDLVDKDQIQALQKRDVEGAVDDYNLAVTLARRFGADIIVTYKANVTTDGREYNSIMKQDLYKCTANVEAKVINASSARMAGAKTVRQKGASEGKDNAANTALERSAKELYEPLIKQILDAWQEAGTGGGQWVEVRVSNLNFKDQMTLYTGLKNMKGINSVKKPQMEKNVVMFAVQGTLTGFDVADKLTQIKELKLEIVDYSQNQVTAKAKE